MKTEKRRIVVTLLVWAVLGVFVWFFVASENINTTQWSHSLLKIGFTSLVFSILGFIFFYLAPFLLIKLFERKDSITPSTHALQRSWLSFSSSSVKMITVRALIFVVATLGSSIGIIFSIFLFGGLFFTQDKGGGLVLLLGIVSFIAWFFYFIIGYYWIRYNQVSGTLKILGTMFGVFALLSSFIGIGLAIAFPSILLMLYIVFVTPGGELNEHQNRSIKY